MIPKIIHYIWLGNGPMPKVADKCLKSWEKYCPDYEIKRWDESNLDLDLCPYVREAYDAKKFAFASDVLRFQILYELGGIYLDIDVELIKPIDEFLKEKCFTGFETSSLIAPGLILGAEKENNDLKNILDSYRDKHFIKEGVQDTTTVCEIVTKYYEDFGLKREDKTQVLENISVYSSEYFSPKSVIDGKLRITNKTISIHHYLSSWYTPSQRFKKNLKRMFNILTFGLAGKAYQKLKEKNKG